MQLKITTDYAIRMTLYLAMLRGVATAADIGTVMAIPQKYVTTVAKPLCSAGILRTVRGTNGGFALNLPPEEITLKQIVESTEGTTRINRCLEPDHYCSRKAAEICPVRQFYQYIQNRVDEAFGNMTIAKLLQEPQQLPDPPDTDYKE